MEIPFFHYQNKNAKELMMKTIFNYFYNTYDILNFLIKYYKILKAII